MQLEAMLVFAKGNNFTGQVYYLTSDSKYFLTNVA